MQPSSSSSFLPGTPPPPPPPPRPQLAGRPVGELRLLEMQPSSSLLLDTTLLCDRSELSPQATQEIKRQQRDEGWMLRELSPSWNCASRWGWVPWSACNLVVSLPFHVTPHKLQQTRKRKKFPACVRASRPRIEPYPTPRCLLVKKSLAASAQPRVSEGPTMVAG